MKTPIFVVVPVYNGTRVLKELVESLSSTYSEPSDSIQFLFLDDGSPDPELNTLFKIDFFQRPDVQVVRRKQNLGFILTVNEGAKLAPPGHDLVLLNSDTQIWTRCFEKFQELALRYPNCGSVTPLTNNGTIASLFQWPAGKVLESWISPREVALTVEAAQLPTPYVPAPTGVGFCMFIPRQAWDRVGELSPVFGKGYGEECDWCRRAIRAGFENLIATEVYVHHSGTASFTSEEKKQLCLRNARLLEQRNPGYDAAVVSYVQRNPIKTERLILLTRIISEISKKKDPERKVFAFFLHHDPRDPEGGGTEKHVQRLMDQILPIHPALSLFPIGMGKFKIRLEYRGVIFYEESFYFESFGHVIAKIYSWIDVLHIHHTLDWPSSCVDLLLAFPISKKILTAHDYFLLCPSINLLKNRACFCSVEPDLNSCNSCLARSHGYWDKKIEEYRRENLIRLQKVDLVLVPSAAVIQYFQNAFGDEWIEIKNKTQVFAHEFSYIPESTISHSEEKDFVPKRMVFIGHLALHKGAEIVAEAIPELQKKGFEVEVWGSYHGIREKKLSVPILPFQKIEELAQLFQSRRPALAVLPSIWAETFSYMMYECIFLSSTPLVVGPYGNPALVVQSEKIGRVMRTADNMGLINACLEASVELEKLRENVQSFRRGLLSQKSNYVSDYFKILNEISLDQRELSSLPLPLEEATLEIERLCREREGVFVRLALAMQGLLDRNAWLKGWVFRGARWLWRGLRVLRQRWKVLRTIE